MILRDIKDSTPNQDTIDHLEGLLKLAKDGEIRSIITISSRKDDTTSDGWSLDRRNNREKLLARIVLLQHDFATNIGLEQKNSILSDVLGEES